MVLNLDDGGISRRLWLKGKREQAFMWILRQQTGGTALDIGGNIGYCTLSLARNFEHVVAVEPDPRSLKVLYENIKLNKLENVKLENFAFSDKCEDRTINLAPKPNLTSFKRTEGELYTLRTMTIDAYLRGKPVSFMKMDVEGSEIEVIAGAKRTIERHKPSILLEVHPAEYKGDDFKNTLLGLVEHGYRIPYVVSAKVDRDKFKVPKLFKQKGYKPYMKFNDLKRAVFKDIAIEDAIEWSSREIEDRHSKKIVRAILLEAK